MENPEGSAPLPPARKGLPSITAPGAPHRAVGIDAEQAAPASDRSTSAVRKAADDRGAGFIGSSGEGVKEPGISNNPPGSDCHHARPACSFRYQSILILRFRRGDGSIRL